MHSLSVDARHNVLLLQFRGVVDRCELAELRESAIRAGRRLDPGFVLVTDLAECERFPPAAAPSLRGLFNQFVSFGLAAECRVVGQPGSRPADVFRAAVEEFDVTVEEYPTRSGATRAATARRAGH
jgi:hypothetical protein